MARIQTRCNGCVFLQDGECVKLKSVCQDGKNVFVDGYCWTKRLHGREHYTPRESLQVVCVLKRPNDVTIDDVLSLGYDKVTFVSLGNIISNSDIKKIVAAGSSYTCIVDSSVDETQLFDVAVNNLRLENGQWAVQVTDDQPLVETTLLNAFEDHIASDKNLMAVIGTTQTIVNICAYKDLGGNRGIPFLDKIKEFDNWEEQCITVKRSQ